MRQIRRSSLGLAEIVGTLMLVLIVVAAAVAFSAFVATYQAQVQAQEAVEHAKSLENIHIVSVAPVFTSMGAFQSMQIQLGSGDVNSMTVTDVAVNDDPVNFNQPGVDIEDQLPGGGYSAPTPLAGANFVLSPEEGAIFLIQSARDFFFTPTNISSGNYVLVDVYTTYQNEFAQTFLAPVAIIHVDVIPLGSTFSTVLDGSDSYQPEGNATLVTWDWTVTSNPSPSWGDGTYQGEQVQTTNPMDNATTTWTIQLTLTNSVGLIDIISVVYAPGYT
jgi:flagellin-like protein